MKIKDYIWKFKWYILADIVMSNISWAMLAFVPVLHGKLVDRVFYGSLRNFIWLALCYFFCYVGYTLSGFISERFLWKRVILFQDMLRKDCYSSVVGQNFREFNKRKVGEYISILKNNIDDIEDYVSLVIAGIKDVFAVLIYAVIVVLYTDLIIAITLFLTTTLSVFSPNLYKKKLSKAKKEFLDSEGAYTTKVTDLFDGQEMVNSRTKPFFKNENNKITDFVSARRHRYGKVKVLGNSLAGFSMFLINIIIFVVCGVLLRKGDITVGIVVAALTYAQAFLDPVQDLLYCINGVNSSKEVVEEFDQIMNEIGSESEANQNSKYLKNLNLKDQFISFKDVDVSYPNKTLHYDFTIETGRKYMITGESGTGKTTLLNILSGRIENLQVKYGSSEEVYYLSQHQHVFSSSANDNITLFGSYPDLSNVEDARLPLYQRIKEEKDCSVLSGGEKQVLKMCRMLVQNKDMLLMDEPFSELDNKSASEVFHYLTESEKTVIMVSHVTDFSETDLSRWKVINIDDICKIEQIA